MSHQASADPTLDTVMLDSDVPTTSSLTDRSKEAISRPPSPPTRPDTPRSSICPARLRPLIPPPNFGAVHDGQVFRSAFPQDRNLYFLRLLNIKTMLVLVATEPSDASTVYVRERDINRLRVDIAPNKDGQVKSSLDSICEALLIMLDVVHYPLHIHCNQGRHRTGCVVACFRKMQGWPIDAILEEYETYAFPKAREGDIKFIRDVFQPELLLEYAKQHGQFDHRPSLMQLLRSDLVSVRMLVKMLSSTDGVARSHLSLKSNTSSKADSGVELSHNTVAVQPDMISLPLAPMPVCGDVEVSVEECGPLSPPVPAYTPGS